MLNVNIVNTRRVLWHFVQVKVVKVVKELLNKSPVQESFYLSWPVYHFNLLSVLNFIYALYYFILLSILFYKVILWLICYADMLIWYLLN